MTFDMGCQAFASLGPATLGGFAATEYQFSDSGFGDSGANFDVFDLGAGTVPGGAIISMGTTQFGVLACGDGDDFGAASSSFYSDGTSFGLPCTPIASIDNTLKGPILATDASSNLFDFTLNTNGSITFGQTSGDEVVVFDQVPSATPESSTLVSLGLGLAALAAGFLLRRNV